MLSPGVVDEVKRLLSEGQLSQRKIARYLGISRASVSAIANGRRPDYAARQTQLGPLVLTSGPAVRCKTCGGRVYGQCYLCHVRRLKDEDRQRCRPGGEQRTRRLPGRDQPGNCGTRAAG